MLEHLPGLLDVFTALIGNCLVISTKKNVLLVNCFRLPNTHMYMSQPFPEWDHHPTVVVLIIFYCEYWLPVYIWAFHHVEHQSCNFWRRQMHVHCTSFTKDVTGSSSSCLLWKKLIRSKTVSLLHEVHVRFKLTSYYFVRLLFVIRSLKDPRISYVSSPI